MPKATFHGHACVLVQGGGKSIVIDPFLTGNPQATAHASDIACDFIVVTHAHGDHLGDTLDIAKRTGATVISNFEIASYCATREVKTHPLHIGGGASFPFGRAKLTIAHHGSSFPDGSYGGTPAGVVLTVDGKRIYHSGDTALTHDMEFVASEGPIDLALLPIGDNFTMGIEDALRAVELIRPRRVVPMHYNTFELIAADPKEFKRRAEAKGFACTILAPGESVDV